MVLLTEDTLVVEQIAVEGYKKVLHITDAKAGLSAIISIHSTLLGPALGGVRIYPYATFEEALNDALRLSKAMSYKSAVAECGWGGGKSVIIADPKTQKTPELLRAFAHAVNRLQGEYIAAEDVGCTPSDMVIMAEVTPYVVGLVHANSSGNPSPYTAWGTFRGIQAVMKKLYGTDDLHGRTIAIQGVGSVGYALAEFLFWSGAKLVLSDVDKEKAKKYCEKLSATFVENDEILRYPCDVLAPCALGGTINSRSIPELRCRAIAGCANNQLLTEADGEELRRLLILYAPDFVINAGGLINVTQELEPGGYDPSIARHKTHRIYDQLMVIFEIAEQNSCSTNKAAISLGDYRLKYSVGRRTAPVQFPFAKKS